MTLDYQGLQEALLAATARHQCSGRSEMERIESCFKSSLECWGKLQQQVRRHGFQSPAEEIHFFKHIKPRFTSHIEYYTCLYHTLLFRPADQPFELARFWRWELRKIEKFYETHQQFCTYMREGHTDLDETYFLRAANQGAQVMTGRIHDLDPGTATPGDYLVTMMYAYELYEIYIRDEIKKLG